MQLLISPEIIPLLRDNNNSNCIILVGDKYNIGKQ